jgi:hypothetical protein
VLYLKCDLLCAASRTRLFGEGLQFRLEVEPVQQASIGALSRDALCVFHHSNVVHPRTYAVLLQPKSASRPSQSTIGPHCACRPCNHREDV